MKTRIGIWKIEF